MTSKKRRNRGGPRTGPPQTQDRADDRDESPAPEESPMPRQPLRSLDEAEHRDELPEFQPPRQDALDDRLKPDEKERAEQGRRQLDRAGVGATPGEPAGYVVAHEAVGPLWKRGDVVTHQQLQDFLHGHSDVQKESFTRRLVELGALSPFYDDPRREVPDLPRSPHAPRGPLGEGEAGQGDEGAKGSAPGSSGAGPNPPRVPNPGP